MIGVGLGALDGVDVEEKSAVDAEPGRRIELFGEATEGLADGVSLARTGDGEAEAILAEEVGDLAERQWERITFPLLGTGQAGPKARLLWVCYANKKR